MATERSNEQVAITWPNSGCAHVTFHTEPLCVFQLDVQCHWSSSPRSQTCANGYYRPLATQLLTLTLWSLEHVAKRRP